MNKAKILLYARIFCYGVSASNERKMGWKASQIRRRFVYAVFAQMLIVTSVSDVFAGEARKSIYEDVPSLVVRLDRYVRQLNQGPPGGEVCSEPVGTAFFIDSTKKPGNLYLVTARHVIDGDNELFARVPLLIEKTAERRIFGLRLKKADWSTHPNIGSETVLPVDVAMAPLAKLRGVRGAAFTHCEKDCVNGLINHLADDPEPPEDVTVYGFPLDIGFQLREPRPLARKGIVALSPAKGDRPFVFFDREQKFFNANVFLLDIDMFRGNSGSPVLRFPLHSFVPYLGGLVSTTNVGHRYAIGEPVSYIRELLDLVINRPRTESTWVHPNRVAFPTPCKRPMPDTR